MKRKQNRKNRQLIRNVQIATFIVCLVLIVILLAVLWNDKHKEAAVSGKIEEIFSEEDTGIDTAESLNLGLDGNDMESGTIEMNETEEDAEGDLQAAEKDSTSGAQVDVSQLADSIAENEITDVTFGIDVAKWQGTIDWKQVANAGTQFAIIRVGYRTAKTGEITEDPCAKYNLQQAKAAGLKLGAYFFSTATTAAEAVEEADWVADFIAQYPMTYPVAYNCEGFLSSENRQYGMSNADRTDMAIAFLDEIASKGYTPMFYAAKNEMEDNIYWDMDRLSSKYKIWVAQYPDVAYPETKASDYSGKQDMWQYTCRGSVPGIEKGVDINIAYFGYTGETAAQNDTAPEAVEANVEALMTFTDCNETVTAKKETNMRSEPSTSKTDTVVAKLTNGDTATRTGIDKNSGWSRLSYNGETLYAVSNYLTTDLTAKPAANNATSNTDSAAGDNASDNANAGNTGDNSDSQNSITTSGNTTTEVVNGVTIKTVFTAANDQVTAKEYVNLRQLPSVTNEAATVVGTLNHGDTLTRTGISNNGWSRLEYNGQVVYAISSYLKSAE